MTCPSEVTIGPYVYQIVVDEPAINAVSYEAQTGLWGACDHRAQRITIRPTLASDQFAETLLHEILHAINQMTGLKGRLDDREEDAVTSTAPALLDVLRRNAGLVTFLTEENA